ncbi:L-asparagine oxygenase [Actinoplanes cyaneus]|uniref:L-asparagine oxygenase n=1 Tax=Actinoplanes cyaneus TaxID=52696 RepID=A0A919IYM8_9ACTN|nr:TauD/TfdA family dioxygenase [Actinoplanes cyaneus]MCW2138210.1 L-asparagine oxygenase [Actinoplanes cyaneus]GID70495.1 L-asparagine oxygenase [Actinoplanes cyaneus]
MELADVSVRLTTEQTESLREACAGAAGKVTGQPLDREAVLAAARGAARALPDRLIEALGSFRVAGNPLGTLVVEGVPTDAVLPPTPAGGDLDDWSALPVATMVQLAICAELGDVIGYADEKQGRLVQDVVPVAGAETRQENSGTVWLELHTENGFHPYKPDHLTLLCLRSDPAAEGRTVTGAVRQVLPRLSAECVQRLRRPDFRIRHSSSFSATQPARWSAPLAVLTGPAGDPELTADFHAMRPLTAAAAEALAELRAAIEDALVGTVLLPGTMIIVDNRAAVHGRTAFTARHDGTDRWLRRCFTVADLRRSRGARPTGSRVCLPLHDLADAGSAPALASAAAA